MVMMMSYFIALLFVFEMRERGEGERDGAVPVLSIERNHILLPFGIIYFKVNFALFLFFDVFRLSINFLYSII